MITIKPVNDVCQYFKIFLSIPLSFEIENFRSLKSNLMKNFAFILFALLGMTFLTSAFMKSDFQDWPVPDKYKKMANPVKSDAGSIAEGKTLWSKHCASCHGKTGKGDGTKAAQLKTEPGDFTKASFQGQPDGSLFYKISEGREDMPSFKKKIPDQDEIWSVINFMRTLKK